MSAPKIVHKDAPQTCLARVKVVISENGSVVVEHEPAPERVPVDEEGGGGHEQRGEGEGASLQHFAGDLRSV